MCLWLRVSINYWRRFSVLIIHDLGSKFGPVPLMSDRIIGEKIWRSVNGLVFHISWEKRMIVLDLQDSYSTKKLGSQERTDTQDCYSFFVISFLSNLCPLYYWVLHFRTISLQNSKRYSKQSSYFVIKVLDRLLC